MRDQEWKALHQERKTELAQQLCKTTAEIFNRVSRMFDEPGESLTIVASVNLVGVTTVVMFLSEDGREAPPTNDDILFACLYIASSCSFKDNGTALIEFDILNLIKILDQFHQLTGRSYERRLNRSLLDRVNEARDENTTTTRLQ